MNDDDADKMKLVMVKWWSWDDNESPVGGDVQSSPSSGLRQIGQESCC